MEDEKKSKICELIIITPTENIRVDCIRFLRIDEVSVSESEKEYHVYDLNKCLAIKLSAKSNIYDVIAIYSSW